VKKGLMILILILSGVMLIEMGCEKTVKPEKKSVAHKTHSRIRKKRMKYGVNEPFTEFSPSRNRFKSVWPHQFSDYARVLHFEPTHSFCVVNGGLDGQKSNDFSLPNVRRFGTN